VVTFVCEPLVYVDLLSGLKLLGFKSALYDDIEITLYKSLNYGHLFNWVTVV
jgi:hypothetical protein